jgi:hypothetical protein
MFGFVLHFCSFSIDVPNSKAILAIIKVTPQQSPTDGGVEVVIQGHDLSTAVVSYCRFGNVVVQGRLLPDTSLQCISPNHTKGEVPLCISLDNLSWSEAVPFCYVQSNAVVWYIIIFLVGIFVLLLFIWTIWRCRNARRQKSSMQRMPHEKYLTYHDVDETILTVNTTLLNLKSMFKAASDPT